MNRKLFACLILIAALLANFCACSETQPKASASEEPKSGVSTKPAEKTEVVLSNNDAQGETAKEIPLGNAKMTPDAEKIVSVDYSPLGGETSLKLTDSAGNEWCLSIPENALPYSERITMQLSEDISTDMVSGKLNAGVILKPEGLQFTLPAALTVTGPIAAKSACVFSGDNSGENLHFSSAEVKTESLSVNVEHFSCYIVYQPIGDSQIKEAADMAAESYESIYKEVKAFLKTSISAPPVPADYSFECKDEDGDNASDSRNRALDMYISRAMLPESELAERLLGAGYEVAKLGGETDTFYYAGLLMQRNLKKADKLINTYMNDSDKLIPVMNFTLKVIKEIQALGAEVPSGYLSIFSGWMEHAADDQIKKIKEEHNYKAMGPAVALIKGAAIMESDFSVSNEFTKKFMEKLKKAMTFKVKYEVSADYTLGSQKMTLSGETEVSWLDENNEKFYTGRGTGKYLSYSHSGPYTTTIDFPNEYPVTVKFINFSPCKSEKIKVQVDVIGAETEVWYNPDIDEKSSDEYSFVNGMAEQLFKEYQAESGEYIFEVPFHNDSETMGSESFSKTGMISFPEEDSATGSITYTIEIIHTPK